MRVCAETAPPMNRRRPLVKQRPESRIRAQPPWGQSGSSSGCAHRHRVGVLARRRRKGRLPLVDALAASPTHLVVGRVDGGNAKPLATNPRRLLYRVGASLATRLTDPAAPFVLLRLAPNADTPAPLVQPAPVQSAATASEPAADRLEVVFRIAKNVAPAALAVIPVVLAVSHRVTTDAFAANPLMT